MRKKAYPVYKVYYEESEIGGSYGYELVEAANAQEAVDLMRNDLQSAGWKDFKITEVSRICNNWK